MTELPLVGYRCPSCNRVSDTVNRVVPIERTTPCKYDHREKTHRPETLSIKTWEGMSEWRCQLCGSVIQDIQRCLVDVFTSQIYPPELDGVERDIDTSEVDSGDAEDKYDDCPDRDSCDMADCPTCDGCGSPAGKYTSDCNVCGNCLGRIAAKRVI